MQLLAESVLLAVVALFGAILLVELLLPAFNTFANKQLSIDYFGNLFVLPVLLGFTLIIGLLAEIYPAFFLSTFRPIVVLRGRFQKGMSTVALRNGLVVSQFVISIALIFGTVVIHQQMSYMQSKNLGFNREHVGEMSLAVRVELTEKLIEAEHIQIGIKERHDEIATR